MKPIYLYVAIGLYIVIGLYDIISLYIIVHLYFVIFMDVNHRLDFIGKEIWLKLIKWRLDDVIEKIWLTQDVNQKESLLH